MNIAQNVRSNYSIVSFILIFNATYDINYKIVGLCLFIYSFDQNIQIYMLQNDRLKDVTMP
jgi:hypothetical protein